MSFNRITMMGRLGKDAESREVGENTVFRFSIANDFYNSIGGKVTTTTEWFNCEYWCKASRVDFFKDVLKKGALILVDGTLRNDMYTGEDGKVRYSTKIKAMTVEIATRATEGTPTNGEVEDMPF